MTPNENYRLREKRKRWLRQIEELKRERDEKIEAGPLGYTGWSPDVLESKIREIQAKVKEINKLDLRTNQEKRGKTRKPHAPIKGNPDLRGTRWKNNKAFNQHLRRMFPYGIGGRAPGEPEPEGVTRLWGELDYSSDRTRLKLAIRKAESARDDDLVDSLKQEFVDLQYKHPDAHALYQHKYDEEIKMFRPAGVSALDADLNAAQRKLMDAQDYIERFEAGLCGVQGDTYLAAARKHAAEAESEIKRLLAVQSERDRQRKSKG